MSERVHLLTKLPVAKNGGRKNSKKSGVKQRKKVHAAHGGLQPDTDMMSLFAGLLQQSASDEDGGDEEGGTTFSFIQDELDEVEIDPGLDNWVSSFWIQSLPLQEQIYPIFSLYNQDFTGCKVLKQAVATLWLAPHHTSMKLLLWFFDS